MPDDKELYLLIGRMESKLDDLVEKVDLLEKKVEELGSQRQEAYGVFVAAKSIWVAGAALLGAFSDNIINWFLHK